ncbi:hypothetical protein [Cohnella sp. AR92]|uniref:hypothetical protein n=1 Tax=Cohnella sp. AR92 TaxID=648716 RepID=UPI0013151D35|nr:hypothetical protein [Cohnella sp. AR92]
MTEPRPRSMRQVEESSAGSARLPACSLLAGRTWIPGGYGGCRTALRPKSAALSDKLLT